MVYLLEVMLMFLDLVNKRDVASWRGYTNLALTLGRSLGGPVGGWMTDSVGWRWSVTF
jgi:predicted MFS family arabinose efflux permease